ncbi:MAG: response regulator [Thermoanaerobaculales bacterium]|nr:response regulator [Thermoanaerobaculales bacterium]
MTTQRPAVWVVDDEPDVLDALALLLRSADYEVVACRGGRELLDRLDEEATGCILLDLRMSDMGGLEVQRELTRRGCRRPVIFLSGHGDIPIAVEAIRAGALDFLEKPVRDRQLFASVDRALDEDRRRQTAAAVRREARELLDSLSPREAQVANLILEGLKTADIAKRLELSPRTVEMHRARLLRRLGARTSAEAVRILEGARSRAGQD